jgi:hypothetical protein
VSIYQLDRSSLLQGQKQKPEGTLLLACHSVPSQASRGSEVHDQDPPGPLLGSRASLPLSSEAANSRWWIIAFAFT